MLLLNVFLALIFAVDKYNEKDLDVLIFEEKFMEIDSESIVFIGSSRIQRSVVEREIADYKIINLGISGNTFLSNFILAKYLIEKSESKKIIIESSLVKEEYSLIFSKLNKEGYELDYELIYETLNTDFFHKTRMRMNFMNFSFFNFFSIKEDIKSIFSRNSNARSFVGYVESLENKVSDESVFLSISDFKKDKKDFNLGVYIKLTQHLILEAKERGKEVYFLLPTTFRKEEEREVVIPFFNLIDSEFKLIYDTTLLKRITNKEYLYDNNHLNSFGAEVFTQELIRLLEEQNIIEPLAR